jgi:hypothetical protein
MFGDGDRPTLDFVSEAGDDRDDVVLDPSLILGTWANASRVHRGRDEITIDFVRRVPDAVDVFRVGRMLMPALAAVELRDQLDEIWRGYTEWPDDV